MDKILDFFDVYVEELRVSVEKNPSEYALRPDETPQQYAKRVGEKMVAAMRADRGVKGINTETPSFRRTCKRLGIGYNQRSMTQRIQEDLGAER
jgi:hypothetical protein